MKPLLIALITIALLGTAPLATAGPGRDHVPDWHGSHDRADGRLKMRVHGHEHRRYGKGYHRGNGWGHGHQKHQWHQGHTHRRHAGGHHRRDHEYRHYRRHRNDRDRGGLLIGIGDGHRGVVIWDR